MAEEAPLEHLFAPKSVALLGASRKEGAVGHTLFRNLIRAEFSGIVYPVNPRWASVGGVRAVPSVAELPEPPELAVLAIPATEVPSVLEELGRKGTRGAIVISAGFREIGGEGVARERALVEVARRHQISLVGPNCFGVINTDPAVRLNATFSETLPGRGNIAFISQSGALGQGILLYARRQGIGLTKFVSVGNRAGVNECDLLADLGTDEATKVVLLYLESLADGRRFLEVAREVAARKPVLIIKSGRTLQGAEATRSHTGNLARTLSDSLFDDVFDEVGVLRAESISDLFRMARAFASCEIPAGPRIAILTNSGGPGILAADVAVRGGLSLPALPEKTRRAIAEFAPVNASAGNPVDLTADATPAAYRSSLRVLEGAPDLDAILVIATPTGNTSGNELARAILSEKRRGRSLVTCLFGVNDLSDEVALLEREGVPNFAFPEEGAQSVCDMVRYARVRSRRRTPPPHFSADRDRISESLHSFLSRNVRALPDHLARGILEGYGIGFPRHRLVRDGRELEEAAREVGYPVVLKVVASSILHKSDVGGVALHLDSAAALRRAFERMSEEVPRRSPGSAIEGFALEEEISGGFEVIVGIQRDPDLGPLVLFGMGGIFAETFRDVAFRPAPLTPESAARLVEGVRASALLSGVRNQPPRDVEALREVLLRISQLAMEQDAVSELDINPLLVLPQGQGVRAADCRIILTPPTP